MKRILSMLCAFAMVLTLSAFAASPVSAVDTFEVVSITIADPETFEVFVEFSKPVHIFLHNHLNFRTSASAGANQLNASSVTYIGNPKSDSTADYTVVNDVVYSRFVKIKYNNNISASAIPTSNYGISFADYYATDKDSNAGYVSPQILCGVNGELLAGTDKQGDTDLFYMKATYVPSVKIEEIRVEDKTKPVARITFSEPVHVNNPSLFQFATSYGAYNGGGNSVSYVGETVTGADGKIYSDVVEITTSAATPIPENYGMRIVDYFEYFDYNNGYVAKSALNGLSGALLKGTHTVTDNGGTVDIYFHKPLTFGPLVDTSKVGIVSAVKDTYSWSIDVTFTDPVHVFKNGWVRMSIGATPKEGSANDQATLSSVTYTGDVQTGEDGNEYSKTVTFKFTPLTADPDAFGMRFVEYFVDASVQNNGTVDASIIKSIDGKELSANAKDGTVDIKYVTPEEMDTKGVLVKSAAIDPANLTATLVFSEPVTVLSTGQVLFCVSPEPSGNGDQVPLKSVSYGGTPVTGADGNTYSDTVIFTLHDPQTDFTNWGIRIVEYNWSSDYADGTVSPSNIRSQDGRGIAANYRNSGGVDICWIPTQGWLNAHSGKYYPDVLTWDEPVTVVSAKFDPAAYKVDFTFSKAVTIKTASQIFLCVGPEPSGKGDQASAKTITYTGDVTTVDGKQYSKNVSITFNALDADVTAYGVRFCEYNWSADFNNGRLPANLLVALDGSLLDGNYYAAGNQKIDLNWVPSIGWMNSHTTANYSPVMSYDPYVGLLLAEKLDDTTVRFIFDGNVKAASADAVKAGGVVAESIAYEDVNSKGYARVIIASFPSSIASAESFELDSEKITVIYDVPIKDSSASFAEFAPEYGDDLTDIIASGEKYSFMNNDTGRMLTVNGTTEFILTKESGTNNYSLKDVSTGKYVDLSSLTPTLTDTKAVFNLYKGSYDRYQIRFTYTTKAIGDDGTGDTAAPVLKFYTAVNKEINTGWYLTKSGDELPKKIVPYGDSITHGVNPDDGGIPEEGYRGMLSAQLIEAGQRVVFVGANVTRKTTLDEPELLRHAGYPGYTVHNIYGVALRRGIDEFLAELQTKYTPDVYMLMIGINDISMLGFANVLNNTPNASYTGTQGAFDNLMERWDTFIGDILDGIPEGGQLIIGSCTYMRTSQSNLNAVIKYNEAVKARIDALAANGEPISWTDHWTAVKNIGDSAISSDGTHMGDKGHTAMADDNYKAFMKLYSENGDANGDGKADGADLILMSKLIAQWEDLYSTCGVDTNGDGSFDNADLILLAKHVAQWDVDLGA